MLVSRIARQLTKLRASSRPTVSFSYFSSVAEPEPAESKPDPPSMMENMKFEQSFSVSNPKSLYDVQEGGFVKIDDKLIKTLLPEGLGGEIQEEFELSGKHDWMVRDAAKLLCRIIDEFGKQKSGAKDTSSLALHPTIELPGLTDRNEWDHSILKVHYYGADISPGEKAKRSNNMSVVKGPGSTVESAVENIRKASQSVALPTKVLLAGSRGVGKSVAMNQLVLHARSKGWLVLFIPRGWDQVQSGGFIEPALVRDGITIFDNSSMSAEVLRGFWKAHHAKLGELPITRKESLTKFIGKLANFREEWMRALSVPGRERFNFRAMRQVIEGEDYDEDQDPLDAEVLENFDFLKFQPKTLGDLARLGVALRDLAGLVVMDLVAELKLVESVPVLIAVDEFNTWEGPTAFEYRNKPVLGSDLCVPKALRAIALRKADSESWQLKNGICVYATSLRHPEGRRTTFENAKSSVPLTITVPNYSQVEFVSAVSRLIHGNRVPESIDVNTLNTFRMFTSSNPRLTREEAVPFFMPIAAAKLTGDFMDPELMRVVTEENDKYGAKAQ